MSKNENAIALRLLNKLYDAKYRIKNKSEERREALAKLNKLPVEWVFNQATDIVVRLPNGLYATVVQHPAGSKIQYMGNILADKTISIYWNKDGFTTYTTLNTSSGLDDFDIEEIVDFTPISTDKNEKPKTLPTVEHGRTIPTLALDQVDQIQRCINLLDTVLPHTKTS